METKSLQLKSDSLDRFEQVERSKSQNDSNIFYEKFQNEQYYFGFQFLVLCIWFQLIQWIDQLSIPSLHSTVVEAEGQSNYAGLKSSLSGIQLVWNQFLGLIIKRFIYTKRRFLLFGILGFVPMILAILVMLLANGKTNTTVFEPR